MTDYSRDWVDTTPPGSRPAKEIDNAIRELRVDEHERWLTIATGFGEDKTIPVDLKPPYKGNVTDRPLVFGPHILHPLDVGDAGQYVVEYVSAVHSKYGQIPIPVGYTIKKLEAWVDVNASGGVTVDFRIVDPSTGANSSLASLNSAVTGSITMVQSGALTHVVVNPEYISVHVFGANNVGLYKIYGFRVWVDVVDNTQGY